MLDFILDKLGLVRKSSVLRLKWETERYRIQISNLNKRIRDYNSYFNSLEHKTIFPKEVVEKMDMTTASILYEYTIFNLRSLEKKVHSLVNDEVAVKKECYPTNYEVIK